MGKLERPDYSFQGQVPQAAIIQAYQEKAMAEEKSRQEAAAAKEQKWIDTAKIVQTGADMITKFTETAKLKAQEDAFQAAQLWVGRQKETDPTTGKTFGEDPNFNPTLEAYMAKAAPEEYKKEKIKSMLEMADGGRGKITGRDIQQFHLVKGSHRVPVDYDEVTKTMTNVITKEPIDPTKYADYQMVRSAPTVKQDASGNWQIIDPTYGGETNRLSSGALPVPKEKYGTVTMINDPLVPENDRKEIVKTVVGINNNPTVKNAAKMLPMLNNVETYLKTDNKVALDRLGGLTQKMIALDSGNLAAWEQRDPGSRDVIQRLRQFAKMHIKGELTNKNKEELVEVLKVTRENLAANVEASAGMEIEQMLELYPQLNKEAMYKKAGLENFKKYISPSSGGRQSPGGYSYTVE